MTSGTRPHDARQRMRERYRRLRERRHRRPTAPPHVKGENATRGGRAELPAVPRQPRSTCRAETPAMPPHLHSPARLHAPARASAMSFCHATSLARKRLARLPIPRCQLSRRHVIDDRRLRRHFTSSPRPSSPAAADASLSSRVIDALVHLFRHHISLAARHAAELFLALRYFGQR